MATEVDREYAFRETFDLTQLGFLRLQRYPMTIGS
jgi:hypothetical protein